MLFAEQESFKHWPHFSLEMMSLKVGAHCVVCTASEGICRYVCRCGSCPLLHVVSLCLCAMHCQLAHCTDYSEYVTVAR